MKEENKTQTLKSKAEEIKSGKGKLSAVKNVMQFTKKIDEINKKLNIYFHLNEDALEQAKEIDERIKKKEKVGKLAGLCFAVKSNICVKEMICNCASKVLENFQAGFNATVIEKLVNEDAIVLGMVNMDEFACGASGETSAFGVCKNPVNPELICGGSSSGSAAAVSSDLCDFSLGTDTGGSIRNPASHCNVVGLKPSYGSVSRYGLIDLSMSLDQIGCLTKSVEDSELIFDMIKGQDNFDSTSYDLNCKLTMNKRNKKEITLGLVNVSDFCDKKIADLIEKRVEETAKKNKWKIKRINLPLDIAVQAYYVLVYAEFFSSTRKFDGRRFGFKIEEKCGSEVLRRILGGSEITKAEYSGRFYRNALKARKFVREQFNDLFKEVDLIVLPTVPRLAHKIGEKISVKEMYNYDLLTIPANLGGICGISVPSGMIDKKPVGIQILGNRFCEDLMFEIGKKFE